MTRPRKPRVRVSIFAPSSPVARKDLRKGVEWLESAGAEVRFPEAILDKRGFLAGTDRTRARCLSLALEGSDIMVAARGGEGCSRLFPLIRRKIRSLAPCSRIIVGSSDVTFLYLFFRALSPQVFVYGPMACRYGDGEFKGFERRVMRGIFRKSPRFPLPYPGGARPAKTGREVRGRLDGGNLSILAASMGTPYEWEPWGTVLYLEDVNEPLYRIDRMLTQLGHAGKLKKIEAVLAGRMEWRGRPIPSGAFRECLMDHFGGVKGPVLAGIPTGHGKTQWPFFLGGTYSVGRKVVCEDGFRHLMH